MNVLMLRTNPCTSDPRVYSEATSLIRAGHEVTVIAWDREKQNPPRQDWDGIKIIRLRTWPPLRQRPAPWLWVGFSLLLWQRQARGRALALAKEKRFDVIHCNDFDTLPVGIRLKNKLKIPLVYDAYEVYGYMVMRAAPPGVATLLLRLERRWIRRVDRIINVSEAQKRYFSSITDKPITIVMNCKPLQSTEYQRPGSEHLTVLYIGGLLPDRAILMLVRAVKELPGVRCLVGGIGAPGYVQAVKDECSRTSNVAFLGRVPFDEVIPMTTKADVVFCMFDPANPNNAIGTPNKLFEAMACGRPIICTRGIYSGELTEREDAGLAVEYSEQALKEAIIKLRDNPELRERLGRNALKAALTKYNWQKQEEKLLELYKGLQRS